MRDKRWGWWSIADDILQQIKDGRLVPGQRLDSYDDLAEKYGVHVATIERSIGVLKWAKVLEGQQGQRGVWVAGAPPDQPHPRRGPND